MVMAPSPQVQEKPAKGNKTNETPSLTVPFVRASDENVQPGNIDISVQLTAAARDLGVFDIPAYGWMRGILLKVSASGGAGGAAVVSQDGPWNALSYVQLTEPNGAPIVQFNSGYELYLSNKYGGYDHPVGADPRGNPLFSAVDANGNFTFYVWIPVEVTARDAVGSLANQDSAGQFKLRLGLNPNATIYSVIPAGAQPTVRVQGWLMAWDQPDAVAGGLPQETAPPGAGTTSFWSVVSGIAVASGQNTIELKRRGNYLRQIIFVLRTGGSRATGNGNWPAELRFMRDAFPARYYDDGVWRTIMYKRTGYTGTADAAFGPENGVRFHDYMHEFDGALGRELRDGWQPTRGSTRLEIQGSFGAASVLDVIYNDVAIAEDVFI